MMTHMYESNNLAKTTEKLLFCPNICWEIDSLGMSSVGLDISHNKLKKH